MRKPEGLGIYIKGRCQVLGYLTILACAPSHIGQAERAGKKRAGKQEKDSFKDEVFRFVWMGFRLREQQARE